MAAHKGNQYAKDNHTKKIKTQEELEKKINDYFKDCDKRKVPYTMTGLANALDIDRITLIRYGDDKDYATLVKKAKSRVEQQIEENGLMGKTNSVFSIFNLKNNYGWKDQQEIKTTNEIENLSTLADMLGFKK